MSTTDYTAELLARAQELAGSGSLVWDVRSGCVTWSPSVFAIHGVDRATFAPSADAVMALVHRDDRDHVRAQLGEALASGGEFSVAYRIVRPDGGPRDLECRGRVETAPDGDAALLVGAVLDVTDRRRAERWLRESASRYRLIVENANDGIWVLGSDGRTDFVNRRVCQLLGRRPEELLGRSPVDFTDAEGAAVLSAACSNGARRRSLELAFLHADGQALWVAMSTSRFDSPSGPAQVLIVTDLTHRRELEQRLRQAAERDRLTGLWNRARFEELLGEELDRATDASSTTIVFLDLDHFKYVNDSLGHQAGDGLLQRIGDLLAATLRDGDELARIGGDEFAVLLRGADQSAAIRATERLLDALRHERWRGMTSLSASAGVAVAQGPQRAGAADLIVAADIAVHQAKELGRNRHAVYTADTRGFTWLEEIRAAIAEERLALYSQPIVPLAGGRRSEELLVRMIGRDGEVISPAAFIPPAEQFGLIGDIDRWVLARALELARDGRAVEVNLSAQSLGDHLIREAVEAAVAGGVRAELLTFEITETRAVRNLDVARDFSTALAELGCAFAIDDFGTGFGSLVYLRHLPIARVKIDRQFVRDMRTNPIDEQVVCAIVSAARAMGQETVAEGVEDALTLERLTEIGVDYAQGFHIQRPAPVEA